MDVADILDDLLAEQAALDRVVADLTPEQWALPTPSPRWSISDQIGHLAFFDSTAALAIVDSAAFIEHRDGLLTQFTDPIAVDDATLSDFRALASSEQLTRWRAQRDDLSKAASTLADGDRVEWYGPSMGAKSFLTARLMEVWAHGQDIVDTLAPEGDTSQPATLRPDTGRLRHIAQLGVITRGWSYLVRGAIMPDIDIAVRLIAPDGETWEWGPADAPESVTGSAGDFCRVVTQRRHVDDTDLVVTGDAAMSWMLIAQAFAGGPSDGPKRRPQPIRPAEREVTDGL